jgi:hypothetical protein
MGIEEFYATIISTSALAQDKNAVFISDRTIDDRFEGIRIDWEP